MHSNVAYYTIHIHLWFWKPKRDKIVIKSEHVTYLKFT